MTDVGLPPGTLSIAQEILSGAGFEFTDIPNWQGIDVLIAEDEFSLAAIYSAKNVAGVEEAIPELQISLANWAAERGLVEKQWDLYVVALVADQLASDEDVTKAETMTSDLRLVRKIIRAGVGPDAGSIRSALAPLLPLEDQRVQTVEPLTRLEERLPEFGVDADVARSAIAAFKQTRKIEWPVPNDEAPGD